MYESGSITQMVEYAIDSCKVDSSNLFRPRVVLVIFVVEYICRCN